MIHRRLRLLPLIVALLPLAGCIKAPPADPVVAAPRFDALDFFAGASTGEATLRVLFKPAVPVHVRSLGRREGGTLVLDQVIVEGAKPPRTREWRIREIAPDRYAGTLTDAVGPVSGETEGNRLHLRFPLKGGFDTQQWLSLAPDGRSAHNILEVRKFGIRIAVLEETIRKD